MTGAAVAHLSQQGALLSSSYLFEYIIKAWPLTGFFVPAFIHQTETLSGSFIHRNHRSAERRWLLQTLHYF